MVFPTNYKYLILPQFNRSQSTNNYNIFNFDVAPNNSLDLSLTSYITVRWLIFQGWDSKLQGQGHLLPQEETREMHRLHRLQSPGKQGQWVGTIPAFYICIGGIRRWGETKGMARRGRYRGGGGYTEVRGEKWERWEGKVEIESHKPLKD